MSTISHETPHRNKWKPWVLWLMGLFLVICIGAGIALGYFIVQFRNMAGPSNCNDEAYDLVRPVLPSNTEIIEEECTSFLYSTYTVIFSMPPDDLPMFQQQHHPSAKIDEWQTDLSDPYLSEEGKQELMARLEKQGAQFKSILYGRYGDGLYQMQILIDTSDPQQYLVYYSNSYGD